MTFSSGNERSYGRVLDGYLITSPSAFCCPTNCHANPCLDSFIINLVCFSSTVSNRIVGIPKYSFRERFDLGATTSTNCLAFKDAKV